MDAFIISKISNYFNIAKNYNFAKEIRNSALTKTFFEKCYKRSSYIVYPEENGMKMVTIPTLKESVNFPNSNFEAMFSKGIDNCMFFWNSKDKAILAYQFLPFLAQTLQVDEEIDEAFFFKVSENSFWAVINHNQAYRFDRFKRAKKITLTGFQYKEEYIDGKMYADYYGEELCVHDLAENQSYRVKFLQASYWEIVSKDLVVIDFSHHDQTIEGVLPSNDLKSDDKRNVLCRMHLVKGTENTINLEFISFLPANYNIIKITPSLGLYYSKTDEEKTINIFKNEKEIVIIDVPDINQVSDIKIIDDDRMYIQTKKEIIAFNVLTGAVERRINIAKKLGDRGVLKEIANFEKIGDYYIMYIVLELSSQEYPWRTYVTDMNFDIIYELEDRKHHSYNE